MRLKTILMAFAVLLAAPAAAFACPDVGLSGSPLSYSASDLYSARSFSVVAGGGENLSNCTMPGTGWVARAPDFELHYTGSEAYDLEFRVVSSCDSILLINDSYGDWFYDDDSNGNSDAGIHINNADSGTYDIWVGTFDPGNCNATLTLETF